jgi:hypothetical protein
LYQDFGMSCSPSRYFTESVMGLEASLMGNGSSRSIS